LLLKLSAVFPLVAGFSVFSQFMLFAALSRRGRFRRQPEPVR
jgi:hypothetical protein